MSRALFSLSLAFTLLTPIRSLDVAIQDAVQRGRQPWLEPIMKTASDLGQPKVVFGALLAVAVFTGPAGPQSVRLTLLALASTNVIVESTKRTVNRTRPDGESKRSNASFPSSHAANAFALAAAMSRRWPRSGWALWPLAILVAISRVYLNRHFTSDVLAGAAVGVAMTVIVFAWAGRRERLRAAAEKPPAVDEV